jgi:hypothetical protein
MQKKVILYFIECGTINDLMLGMGQEIIEISVKAAKATFSTGSLAPLTKERIT